MEKSGFTEEGAQAPPYDHGERSRSIVDEKGIRIGEAADMYGDVESAEEYGYVTRGYVLFGFRS